ncbi:cell cycle control protein [Trametes versicolor FP-101664 SS1]|uniref:cell cycle control protein n=1 Tax=Trametes versicolor (strain FP-101664) TaxID=717944 RepID=UPI00046212DA|nr:cell cycle control protein [Trametes versicolor FP-101664 SS1]EIW60650.1 cell cycle control protein [Trametes versicolor FP-101664 SS1]
MGLFNRKKGGDDGAPKKEKGSWRRPANTAFKQQRLKAWQPILTPRTVLPTLFIIGVIFAPIGALLVWGSGLVSEINIDYTDCELLSASNTTSTDTSGLTFTDIPSSKFSYKLRAADAKAPFTAPTYAFINRTGATDAAFDAEQQCVVQFDVPADMEPPVLLYYKLTNFYQNHRRYVKSLNQNQLRGDFVSASSLGSGDCKPLGNIDGKAVYPCGLIANSLFNDSFSGLVSTTDSTQTYNLSETGIAWPGEAKKYATSPGYDIAQITPPPNWAKRYPDGYTTDNVPNLKEDEHFQNWMRTAGLPTFSKLFGRNDNTKLLKGRYQIVVNLNFPVRSFSGTKSIVISTVSWMGGKNPFLGWAYVAAASLLVLLGFLGTIRHLIKPRKLGDMSLLSFNR